MMTTAIVAMATKHVMTYVDETTAVARSQIVQDGRLVQVGQVGHVLHFLELWRVHLLNRIFLHCLLLQEKQCSWQARFAIRGSAAVVEME